MVPLLRRDRNGKLQAKTVLKALRRQHPERCTKGQLRTLHRRVRDWRALVHLVRAQANPFPHAECPRATAAPPPGPSAACGRTKGPWSRGAAGRGW